MAQLKHLGTTRQILSFVQFHRDCIPRRDVKDSAPVIKKVVFNTRQRRDTFLGTKHMYDPKRGLNLVKLFIQGKVSHVAIVNMQVGIFFRAEFNHVRIVIHSCT